MKFQINNNKEKFPMGYINVKLWPLCVYLLNLLWLFIYMNWNYIYINAWYTIILQKYIVPIVNAYSFKMIMLGIQKI